MKENSAYTPSHKTAYKLEIFWSRRDGGASLQNYAKSGMVGEAWTRKESTSYSLFFLSPYKFIFNVKVFSHLTTFQF
jgi:hypothetical protein